MRKGFTLIELLVVIAIIAILAAILFPVFARARAKAQQASCLSNIKQLQLGMIMYASDNDQRYPLAGGTGIPDWANAVYPYVKNVQIYLCPSDIASTGSVTYNGVPSLTKGSYGINSDLLNNNDAMINYPAEMLGLIDAVNVTISNTDLPTALGNIATSGVVTNTCHNNGCNQSYVDGHVKWIAFQSIPSPKTGDANLNRHYWYGID